MWIEIYGGLIIVVYSCVTTHTGGVDWNLHCKMWFSFIKVTTHTGGVDWNGKGYGVDYTKLNVTTHTGGVDWNLGKAEFKLQSKVSPPTRVVWIEIRR